MNNWTVTKDKLLSLEEVTKLYKELTDAKDLSIQRKINLVFVRDHYILKILLETGVRVSELTNLISKESVKHLEIIHEICKIAKNYKNNDVKFLD